MAGDDDEMFDKKLQRYAEGNTGTHKFDHGFSHLLALRNVQVRQKDLGTTVKNVNLPLINVKS